MALREAFDSNGKRIGVHAGDMLVDEDELVGMCAKISEHFSFARLHLV